MRENRSMPRCAVIPVLAYPDVEAAAEWLSKAFGFSMRLKIGSHRAQMAVGDGAIVLTALPSAVDGAAPRGAGVVHCVMVRVEDVDALFERATRQGARGVSAPAHYPYGERQCSVLDLAGHRWTFSQTVEDVAPEDWAANGGCFRARRRRLMHQTEKCTHFSDKSDAQAKKLER